MGGCPLVVIVLIRHYLLARTRPTLTQVSYLICVSPKDDTVCGYISTSHIFEWLLAKPAGGAGEAPQSSAEEK